jgi:hypothetical protein
VRATSRETLARFRVNPTDSVLDVGVLIRIAERSGRCRIELPPSVICRETHLTIAVAPGS